MSDTATAVRTCDECPTEIGPRNKTGLCRKHYNKQYYATPEQREKQNAYHRDWSAKQGAEYHYDRQLRYTFGITIQDYYRMLEDQGGKCATCHITDPAEARITAKFFNVDHDHRTGQIRGLLCDNCNKVLGLVRDEVIVLGNMLNYLGVEFGD